MLLIRVVNLIYKSSFFSDFSIAVLNNLLTYLSEYWYIGSIPARSAITKYKIDPQIATLLYWFLVSLISYSTSLLWSILTLISADVFFESSKTIIKSSSSKIYSSVDSDRSFKILISSFFKVFWSFAIWRIISFFFFSMIGFS